MTARVAQSVQRLANCIDAIVVKAARKAGEFIFEVWKPCRILREQNPSSFEKTSAGRGASFFITVHFDRG